MSSEYAITFNYNKAIKQADELIEISEGIGKIASGKLSDGINIIDKNWNGENSNKFISKSNKLKTKVEDSAKDIKNIADTIKKMAKVTYDAEMESIRIAKEKQNK